MTTSRELAGDGVTQTTEPRVSEKTETTAPPRPTHVTSTTSVGAPGSLQRFADANMANSAHRRRSLSQSSSTNNKSLSRRPSKRGNKKTKGDSTSTSKPPRRNSTSSGDSLAHKRGGGGREGGGGRGGVGVGGSHSDASLINSTNAKEPDGPKPAYCPCSCHNDSKDEIRTLYHFDESAEKTGGFLSALLYVIVILWIITVLWYIYCIVSNDKKDLLFDPLIDKKR